MMLFIKNFSLKPYQLIIKALWRIPVFLIIDSQYGDNWFGYGQALATFLVFLAFVRTYSKSSRRVKDIMLIGIVVGLGGEILFSIILGMYHYRLGNIPLWLAFGHGLIFASVYNLSHEPWIKKNQALIEKILLIFAVTYGIFWLIWANDWYGFLSMVTFLIVLFSAKKSRLFFLIMYAIVCYIEQVGTAIGCWYWPETAFGQAGWLPSGNPPSGIAVFYFLFDAVVLWIYLHIHSKTKIRYQKIQAVNLNKK